MALIKCPECGKEISDKAKSCPGCGCPISSSTKIVKIKLPKTEQMADGFVGLFTSKATKIIANAQIIWSGKHGETASFEIDEPTTITIDLGTWGNPVTGEIEPGHKYNLVQDFGFHLKATFRLTEIDVIDSD